MPRHSAHQYSRVNDHGGAVPRPWSGGAHVSPAAGGKATLGAVFAVQARGESPPGGLNKALRGASQWEQLYDPPHGLRSGLCGTDLSNLWSVLVSAR